jgi:hypothetical protein
MQFFTGQKRRLMLCNVALKRNAQNEKRIKLDFSMPLTGQSVVGMPTPVMKAFEAVGQLDNGIIDTELAVKIEAQTVEFYPHDQKNAPVQLQLKSAELQSLTVSRPDTDQAKKRDEVTLYFTTTVPASKTIWDWAYANIGAEMFSVFTAAQPQLEMPTTPAKQEDLKLSDTNKQALKEVAQTPVATLQREIGKPKRGNGHVGAAS